MSSFFSEMQLGTEFKCGCGKTHSISTRDIRIGPGVCNEIDDCLAVCGIRGNVLWIYDENTFRAAAGCMPTGSVDKFIFPGEGVLAADEQNLERLRKEIKPSHSALIAVGAGTINDLVKVAAFERALPYIVIATAPSMDGYLSANAAILGNGVKKAVYGLKPPIAVIADTVLMASAPAEMIKAGLGDAIAKYISISEWYMNSAIRGEAFCQNIAEKQRKSLSAFLHACESETTDSPVLMSALMGILLETGIFMQMTGNSFPASGGEHCISHAMEMTGYARCGHAPSLHGLQVAAGTSIVLKLYRSFLNENSEYDFIAGDIAGIYGQHIEDWKAYGIDMSGIISEKIDLIESCRSDFAVMKSEAHLTYLNNMLADSGRIAEVFDKFKLPCNAKNLGLAEKEFDFAVAHAVDVRKRLSIIDLFYASCKNK